MPTIQLADFSGGINNAINDTLISLRTLVEAQDTCLDSGVPEPEVGQIEVTDPDIEELSLQNGNRSIVRFGNHFYFSDNETGELGSSLGYIGVDPPVFPIRVDPGNPGDRFSGKYKYIALYATKENHRSPAFLPGQEDTFQVEINADLATTITLSQGGFPEFSTFKFIKIVNVFGSLRPDPNFAQHWFLSIPNGTRVNHLGKSWLAKSDINIVRFLSLTPTEPDVLDFPEIIPGDTSNRWEDITGKTETAGGLDSIIISGFSSPPQAEVDRVLIFRTLENGDVYYFNTTILLEQATSYTDKKSDAQIAFNEQLTIANAFPPIYTEDGRVGGKYLTEIDERFYLAVGDRMYMSLVGNPHAWVPEHSVRFDSDITALAVAGQSVLVFLGKGTPWIVSGNKEDGNLAKVQIASNQGCPNWKTVSYVGNTPVWQSFEGECTLGKLPLGQDPGINVITTNRYKFPRIGNFALSRDNKYYLFFDDHVVVDDLSRGQIVTRSLTGEYGYVNRLTNTMYLVKDSKFFDANGGTSLTQLIKTGKLYDGRIASLKRFEWLDIQGSERLDVSVWYDEDLVVDNVRFDSPPFNQRIKLPEQHAYMIQVQVVSPSKITNISIDYKLVEEK